MFYSRRRCRFWHATQDSVAPYIDHILHRDRCWAISIASGSVRLWDLRSCCMVLSHVMRGRPRALLQSSGGRVDRILLASVLSSIRALCPKRVRRRDWTIAMSLGCPVSLRTSSFPTNWCHLIPSSIRRLARAARSANTRRTSSSVNGVEMTQKPTTHK